jgi:ATP-dependent protease ClpP protease subunit
MKKKAPKPKRNSDVFSAVKANETKLSQTAMHLEYLFDRGVNFKDRTITITGEIDYPLFDIVDAAMAEFERGSKKGVTIKIFSEGGSVYEALAIVGRLKRSKCYITTEGYGCIMSAATIILACGDSRRMSEYATFMHHESSYATEGRHSQNKNYVEHAEREEELWAKCMAEMSNKSKEFWREFGTHLDEFFFAEDCLEHGVIDEVF